METQLPSLHSFFHFYFSSCCLQKATKILVYTPQPGNHVSIPHSLWNRGWIANRSAVQHVTIKAPDYYEGCRQWTEFKGPARKVLREFNQTPINMEERCGVAQTAGTRACWWWAVGGWGGNILIQLPRQAEPYDVFNCSAVPAIMKAGLQQRGQPAGRPWERLLWRGSFIPLCISCCLGNTAGRFMLPVHQPLSPDSPPPTFPLISFKLWDSVYFQDHYAVWSCSVASLIDPNSPSRSSSGLDARPFKWNTWWK